MNNHGSKITLLTEDLVFPPVRMATKDGLLAVGGDLSPERLILAYRSGIFPWFNDDSFILWWSPDPRTVLFPKKIRISKSMRKIISDGRFTLSCNKRFEEVVKTCASIKRKGQEGSWITKGMLKAYTRLFEMGYAKSYEVWENEMLVGGLYGVDLGNVFCGESMFSTKPNASKFALIQLALELEQKNYSVIDFQEYSKHLESLGAEKISRDKFLSLLNDNSKGGNFETLE